MIHWHFFQKPYEIHTTRFTQFIQLEIYFRICDCIQMKIKIFTKIQTFCLETPIIKFEMYCVKLYGGRNNSAKKPQLLYYAFNLFPTMNRHHFNLNEKYLLYPIFTCGLFIRNNHSRSFCVFIFICSTGNDRSSLCFYIILDRK